MIAIRLRDGTTYAFAQPTWSYSGLSKEWVEVARTRGSIGSDAVWRFARPDVVEFFMGADDAAPTWARTADVKTPANWLKPDNSA